MQMQVEIVGPMMERSLKWPDDVATLMFGRSTDRSEVLGHLPDPQKSISRKHFMLSRVGSGVLLTVVSQTSGVLTPRGEVGCGQSAELGDGDSVRVADYTITLRVEPSSPTKPPRTWPKNDSDAMTPFPPPSEKGFADAAWGFSPPTSPTEFIVSQTAPIVAPELEWVAGIAPSIEATDSVVSPVPMIGPASWAKDESALHPRGEAGAPGIPMPPDWADWFPEVAGSPSGDISDAPRGAGRNLPVPGYEPHEASSAKVDLAHPVPPLATAPEGTVERLSTAAFLRGLGVDQDSSGIVDGAAMEKLGRGVRNLIEGMNALLVNRAAVKRDLRANGRTMLAGSHNNPLKNSLSVKHVVDQLMAPSQGDAYLPLDLAMKEAVEDLRHHEFALVAASRAAIEGILKDFHPARLRPIIVDGKSKLPQFLDNARLWDAYIAHYEKQEQSMADWVERAFSQHFMPTYDRLSNKDRGRGS